MLYVFYYNFCCCYILILYPDVCWYLNNCIACMSFSTPLYILYVICSFYDLEENYKSERFIKTSSQSVLKLFL